MQEDSNENTTPIDLDNPGIIETAADCQVFINYARAINNKERMFYFRYLKSEMALEEAMELQSGKTGDDEFHRNSILQLKDIRDTFLQEWKMLITGRDPSNKGVKKRKITATKIYTGFSRSY